MIRGPDDSGRTSSVIGKRQGRTRHAIGKGPGFRGSVHSCPHTTGSAAARTTSMHRGLRGGRFVRPPVRVSGGDGAARRPRPFDPGGFPVPPSRPILRNELPLGAGPAGQSMIDVAAPGVPPRNCRTMFLKVAQLLKKLLKNFPVFKK